MKRFFVTVNGVRYDVWVEEVPTEGMGGRALPPGGRDMPSAAPEPGAEGATQVAPTVPIVRPAVLPTPPALLQPASGRASQSKDEGSAVEAPLPGAILAVHVAVGDWVEEGQVLMLLEAMKMENEVVAPRAGRVTAVYVEPGQSVALGDVLCVLAGASGDPA